MTNSDIRLQTSWYSNLKRKKLQRRLGGDGVAAFVDLLIYVGVNCPDGDLSEFTAEDIEAMAQWGGAPGLFFTTITSEGTRFIDGEPGSYRIHDWEKNNPWACGSERRSEAARIANRIRWASESDTDPIRTGVLPDETGLPPSVSVSVSDPVPSPSPEESYDHCPVPAQAPTPNGRKRKPKAPEDKTPARLFYEHWLAEYEDHFGKKPILQAGDVINLQKAYTSTLKEHPDAEIRAVMFFFFRLSDPVWAGHKPHLLFKNFDRIHELYLAKTGGNTHVQEKREEWAYGSPE